MTVRRVAIGTFCATATVAVNPPSPATDIAMAGVDYAQTVGPEGNASAMPSSSNSGCNTGEFKVFTTRLSVATGSASTADDVAFWIAIP
jgi:hypothetical protein